MADTVSPRTREEILAEMTPYRLKIITLGEHINDWHGVSPQGTNTVGGDDSTDPANMEDHVRIGWLKRYAPDVDITDEDLDVLAAIEEARNKVSCDLTNCPGIEGLQKLYDALIEARNTLRDELPDITEKGPIQAIRPHGLDVSALTSIQELIDG